MYKERLRRFYHLPLHSVIRVASQARQIVPHCIIWAIPACVFSGTWWKEVGQMATLRFGVKTAPQHTTYDDMLRVWLEADTVPIIEHAWLFDHFMPLGSNPTGPCLEGWSLLAAYA